MAGNDARPAILSPALDPDLSGLEGLLPYARQDELSGLLSGNDIATLRHLVESGMGANTLRALASDLAYLERWCQAAYGRTVALASKPRPDPEVRRASPLGSDPQGIGAGSRHA